MCHLVLGWGEYESVIQSYGGTTTGVLLNSRMGRLQECNLVLRTMGRLQECHLVVGWGEYKSVIQS